MFPHRLTGTHFPRPGIQLGLFYFTSPHKRSEHPFLISTLVPRSMRYLTWTGAGLVMAIFQEDLQWPAQSHTEAESRGWEQQGGAMRAGVHEHRVHGGWGGGGKASIYSLEGASLWPKFISVQEDQGLSRFAQGSGKGHRDSLPFLPAIPTVMLTRHGPHPAPRRKSNQDYTLIHKM